MQCSAMKQTPIRRYRRVFWVAAALALFPFCTFAQSSDMGFADEGELLTMLLPERIALPIGDEAQRLEVSVYKPHNYDPTESYPLLVVLDADPLLGLLKTLNFLWVEEGKAVPVILVGLPFGASADRIWANRSHYLLPKAVGVIDCQTSWQSTVWTRTALGSPVFRWVGFSSHGTWSCIRRYSMII